MKFATISVLAQWSSASPEAYNLLGLAICAIVALIGLAWVFLMWHRFAAWIDRGDMPSRAIPRFYAWFIALLLGTAIVTLGVWTLRGQIGVYLMPATESSS